MVFNLTELFEVQSRLDGTIEINHPGEEAEVRIHKKNLALLVELGELANEQRSWKFWSQDQEPRVKLYHFLGSDNIMHQSYTDPEKDEEIKKWLGFEKVDEVTNPLLEEYVDCLHFILSIGNFINHETKIFEIDNFYKAKDITGQFLMVFEYAISMQHDDYYEELIRSFLQLGIMIGFSETEIINAYMDKNKINHRRQEQNY